MSTFDASAFLKHVTSCPGVYCMRDEAGVVIYVGKAKNLKKRLSSYFSGRAKDLKTERLVAHIQSIEITVTARESEALLLEINLIKRYTPRYNILFKDDKSYPYLYLSTQHTFAKMIPIRGKPDLEGNYCGPYPNMAIVKETIQILQKIFKLRSCDESTFNHRTRPCLMYQIKRCSAPCVGYIGAEEYNQNVQHVQDFLNYRSGRVVEELAVKMLSASDQNDFEKAARLRDQIKDLQQLRSKQFINTASHENTDVLAGVERGSIVSMDMVFVREGQVIGNQSHIHRLQLDETIDQVMTAFLEHYYLQGLGLEMLPHNVVLDRPLSGLDIVSESLSILKKERPRWLHSVRGLHQEWRDLALMNAQQALETYLQRAEVVSYQLECLARALQMEQPIERMECFDVSHSSGENPVASCVVMTVAGLAPGQYRRFNLENIPAADDYAGIYQAVFRRYEGLVRQGAVLPDIILIDGGKGQLSQAYQALTELGLQGQMRVVSLAKGPERRAGVEQLFYGVEGLPLFIPYQDPARAVMQRLRDESHRFALKTHRSQRDRLRRQSLLQGIAGVGPKKRQILLNHFGGLEGLKKASVKEIAELPGFSLVLAQRVLDFFSQIF